MGKRAVGYIRVFACAPSPATAYLSWVEVPGKTNIYVATGTGRNGILLGPGMGRALAQLITTGGTTLSIAPFALERFTQAGSSAATD